MADISIQSKVYKSREQKAYKITRHRDNAQHRATLNSLKATTTSPVQAAALQNCIDDISRGIRRFPDK